MRIAISGAGIGGLAVGLRTGGGSVSIWSNGTRRASCRSGAGATSVDQHGRLVLEGGEVVEADVVIGADGAQSAVRRTLLGDTPPRYTGEVTGQR
jgi:hypothetical protein